MTQFVTLIDSTKKERKLTKFTHIALTKKGWEEVDSQNSSLPNEYVSVVYLGCCENDGDMFACYDRDGYIEIYKGEKGDEFEA